MAAPILPDTDVLVDFLRGHERAVALVRAGADRMILSSVSVAELYAGVKGDQELAALDAFASASCRGFNLRERLRIPQT